MPNQLSIPFKNTETLQIKSFARSYILSHSPDTHPDAFKWDIHRWETLRKDSLGGVVHVDRVKKMIEYHAQLVFILTKLPPDIGMAIAYYPAFDTSGTPVSLANLEYERCCLLFNLGALCSQLASAEDRANPHGLKQALLYNQQAAGVFNFLRISASPKLRGSLRNEDMPIEMTGPFLHSIESLLLAQAQECAWQRAVMDNYKNGVIAKLAAQVSLFYEGSFNLLRGASPSVINDFPSYWAPHLQAKQLHFEAASQYRKSVDDLESNRYGIEIARLLLSKDLIQRSYSVARRAGIAPAVLQDIQSLRDTVEKNVRRSERDNDFIYHQEIPPSSALQPIVPANLVKAATPSDLQEPKAVIGKDGVIFGELLAWGARVAIDVYKDRRQNWLKDEVIEASQRIGDASSELLRSLNLPAALEALEKPIGLPPSLLRKAEEVRLEDGPKRIEESIQNVQMLAKRDSDILSEAMDILDQEAEEDETFRAETPTNRIPSDKANQELIQKEQQYRTILDKAAESDEVVRSKWDDWESSITELTWNEADLEASVPSSTVSRSARVSSNSTQAHARNLRVLLESLDDLQRARHEQVTRAQRLAEAEDITPKVLKAASAFEQWLEVQPAMLEDVLDVELAKYEKFHDEIERNGSRQEELLESIKEKNQLFLQMRKEDPVVKEREHALQSLDLAYHKYKEITRNLDEGLQFYNQFSEILTQFREKCKQWVNMRRIEMQTLIRSMESLSVEHSSKPSDTLATAPLPQVAHPKGPEVPDHHEPPESQQARSTPQKFRPAFDLPPPDSDDWERPTELRSPARFPKPPARRR